MEKVERKKNAHAKILFQKKTHPSPKTNGTTKTGPFSFDHFTTLVNPWDTLLYESLFLAVKAPLNSEMTHRSDWLSQASLGLCPSPTSWRRRYSQGIYNLFVKLIYLNHRFQVNGFWGSCTRIFFYFGRGFSPGNPKYQRTPEKSEKWPDGMTVMDGSQKDHDKSPNNTNKTRLKQERTW